MYARILVPTDGTELSIKAVVEAARLASRLGSKLLLLHVRSPIDARHHPEGGALTHLPPEVIQAEIEDDERHVLDAAVRTAAESGVAAEVAFTAAYKPAEAINRVCREQGCDLIVMASHGRGRLAELVVGGTTHKVLTNAPVPVLVVH